jgi:hypothetical protein
MEPEKSLAGKNLGNLARYPVVCHDHALSHRFVDGQVRLVVGFKRKFSLAKINFFFKKFPQDSRQ